MCRGCKWMARSLLEFTLRSWIEMAVCRLRFAVRLRAHGVGVASAERANGKRQTADAQRASTHLLNHDVRVVRREADRWRYAAADAQMLSIQCPVGERVRAALEAAHDLALIVCARLDVRH